MTLFDETALPTYPPGVGLVPGDLWALGPHRLACGDAADPEAVRRLLTVGGEMATIDMVHTDPPYNTNTAPRIRAGLHRKEGRTRTKHHEIQNDNVVEFERVLDDWIGNLALVLKPGGPMYVWGGYYNCELIPRVMAKHNIHWQLPIIWVKNVPTPNRRDFMAQHEWCFYGWKKGAKHPYYGPSNATDVWQINNVPRQQMVHLTQKPLEIPLRAITYSSKPGETVLDLFGGSGSTLFAAHQLGRRCYMMEITPDYCGHIIRQWERLTGIKAERISNDR